MHANSACIISGFSITTGAPTSNARTHTEVAAKIVNTPTTTKKTFWSYGLLFSARNIPCKRGVFKAEILSAMRSAS